MKQVLAAGPVAAAVAVVVGAGVAYGVFTDRWGPSGQLERAVAALDRVPARAGEWVQDDRPSKPIEDDALKLGGIKGYVHREYVNARTGERVTVLIVCGRGGPISVHTPDVCYAGAGFRQVAPAETATIEVGGRPNTFSVARFAVTGGPGRRQQEIWWSWTPDGGVWDAPGNPRLAYARLPAVYKMYVIHDVLPTAQADGGSACRSFLEQAIPAFAAALAPAAE